MTSTSEEKVHSPPLPADSLTSAYEEAKELVRWLKLGIFSSVQSSGGLDERPPFLNTKEYQEWIHSEPDEKTEEQRTFTCVAHGKQAAVAHAVVQDVRQRFAADMVAGRVNMAYAVCNFQFQAQALPIDVFLALLKQLLPEHYKAAPFYTYNILTGKEDRTAPSLDDVVRVLQAVLAHFHRIVIVVQDLDRYTTETWDELQARMRALQTSHRGLYLLTVVSEQSDDDDDKTHRAWMERIQRQPAEKARLAEQALSHVVCASFPLTVTALREALAVQEGDKKIDSQRMPPMDEVLDACLGLLVVWPHGDDNDEVTTVHFVDAAALDWLQRERSLWLPRANQDVLATFLAYLALNNLYYRYSEVRKKLLANPLYSHALLRWTHHAERVFEDRSPGIAADLLDCAFFSDGNKMRSAIELWQHSRRPHMTSESERVDSHPNAYHAVASFGSTNLLYALRYSALFSADVDMRNARGRTVLALAADLGLVEVAHLLLQEPQMLTMQQPVDVDAYDEDGHGPLFLAVRNGHAAMAHLLLDHGAHVATRDIYGVSVLDTASEGGDPAIVTRLLQHYAQEEQEERDELHSTQEEDQNDVQMVGYTYTTTCENDTNKNTRAREEMPPLPDSLWPDLYDRSIREDYTDYEVCMRRDIPLGPQPLLETEEDMESAVPAADSPLCATCASLDLGTLFSKPPPLDWNHGTSYEADDGWASNACGLCHLVAAGFIKTQGTSRPFWKLFSSTRLWLSSGIYPRIAKCYVEGSGEFRLSPAAVEAAAKVASPWLDTLIIKQLSVRNGFIGRLGSNDPSGHRAATLRRLSPSTANLVQARGWIDSCIQHHSRCQHRVRRPIPHLRLIDCKTRTIVGMDSATSTTATFLALSYVWGPLPPGPITNRVGCKITATERVVEDAICATVQLDYRYLWVDRHCITTEDEDADAPRRRAEGLQSMNRVYENAEATIVAVAGRDSSFGLPGIRSTAKPIARHPQVCRRVQGHLLSSFPPDPEDVIRESAWYGRAWTYQEAFLSRRMLFFSEDELSFECDGMVARESVDLPLPVRRIVYETLSIAGRRRIVQRKADNSTHPLKDLWRFIQEYAKRHLTFQADILNAFLGIFQRYTDTGQPVRHVCGLPLMQEDTLGIRKEKTIPLETLVLGLCWIPADGAGARRPGFPSWSWTGWTGDGFSSMANSVDLGDDEPPDMALAVPKDAGADSPGRVIPWLAFSAMSDADRALLPQNLHLRINAPVLSANVYRSNSPRYPFEAILHSARASFRATIHLCKDIKNDAEFGHRLVRDTLNAVAVGYTDRHARLFLLLEKVDNRWQRIGVAESKTGRVSQSIGNVQTIVIE